MKALNCANCGANLNYQIESPVAICNFCDSINILENIEVEIYSSNNILNDAPPKSFKELKPRVMLSQEKFMANYWENNINAQGGHLLISNTEIFFKPHKLNFGNLSKKYIKISDIANIKKTSSMFGLSRELHITDKNGNVMELVSWNRNKIIAAIELRKKNLI